jgi:DNA-binding response OmpR family regulator
MAILIKHQGNVVMRDVLFDTIWQGADGVCDNILRVYICKINKKLKLVKAPVKIANRWGSGYAMENQLV